jgi:hypothetical protein
MMKIKPIGVTPEQFAKRAFLLVYQACDEATGMGTFQAARVAGMSDIPEGVVWRCVVNQEDYPGAPPRGPEGEVYGDYVFGRMMKWGLKYDSETITTLNDRPFDKEYQSFAGRYSDHQAIFDATALSLGCGYEVVEQPS